MSLVDRVRSLFTKKDGTEATERSSISDAVESLEELRGDKTTPQPALRGGYSPENVKNAARDLGPNPMTGPDAIGDVGEGYRSST